MPCSIIWTLCLNIYIYAVYCSLQLCNPGLAPTNAFYHLPSSLARSTLKRPALMYKIHTHNFYDGQHNIRDGQAASHLHAYDGKSVGAAASQLHKAVLKPRRRIVHIRLCSIRHGMESSESVHKMVILSFR